MRPGKDCEIAVCPRLGRQSTVEVPRRSDTFGASVLAQSADHRSVLRAADRFYSPRRVMWAVMGYALASAALVRAQSGCPSTITITAAAGGSSSSSFIRQVITVTDFNTVTVLSDGPNKRVHLVTNIREVSTEVAVPNDQIMENASIGPSCPWPTTITVISPTLESVRLSASSTTISTSSASVLASGSTSSGAITRSDESISGMPFSQSGSPSSWRASPSSPSSKKSESLGSPRSSTSPSVSSVSPSSASAASLSSSAVASVPVSLSSSTPRTSSQADDSTPNVTTSGIPPDFWETPKPSRTISCDFPCTVSLPCYSFSDNSKTTITVPPWTTSLCRNHCGDVEFSSRVTTTFPNIIADRICYFPVTLTTAEMITPAPYYGFGSSTMVMSVHTPWTTCTPHMPMTASDGTCGPDNHYLCPSKKCCGKDGKCGTGSDYCDEGCQLNWGLCWKNSTSCHSPNYTSSDNDSLHPIPIFPIWPDTPTPDNILPPGFKVDFGHVKFPDIDTDIEWPPIDIVGGLIKGKIECGWLACYAITGWFKVVWPQIEDCNIVTKTLCRLFRLNCCPHKGSKSSNDGSILPDSDCPFCGPPPEETGLEGGGKVCDEDLKNCTDLPEEETCSSSSSIIDKTVYCSLNTATAGAPTSVKTCTSTAQETRSGCDLAPATTTTVTTTACEKATATQTTVACSVVRSGTLTQTSCFSTFKSTITGCTVSDGLTSSFETGCAKTTASRVAVSCSVATAQNSTRTYCPSTSITMISGCDVTATTTSLFSTDCFSRTTATDMTKSCFAMPPTVVRGSTITPSATCTATASSVWSGCEITGSTTSDVSTSYPTCNGSPQITFEPVLAPFTFASNLSTTSSAACGPPTSSGLGPCTKMINQAYIVTEAGQASSTGAAKRQESSSSNNPLTCYCPSNTAALDIWPVTVCGTQTWCPNEATAGQTSTGTPAPITLSS